MKTYRDGLRARVCSAFVLAFCLIAGGSAARAQVSSGLPTAPIGRMRLSFGVVPAPLGTIEGGAAGFQVSGDTAVAFGLRPAFDYSFNDYIFVGVSPQLLLNVKGDDDDDDAAKELDLLVRLGGHAPVADNLHLYGYLAPGYSIIYLPGSVNIEDPAGFVLGVAAGAIYSFSDRLFAVADIGYQLGFQQSTVLGSDVDFRTRYLLIGLGVGVKL